MFMMLKNTPYRWLAYMVGWFIFDSFIGYSKRYDLTLEFFVVSILISLLVNSICSYKFGKEKGKIAGVIIFIIGLVVCILIAFFIYAVALGASMMHQVFRLTLTIFYPFCILLNEEFLIKSISMELVFLSIVLKEGLLHLKK